MSLCTAQERPTVWFDGLSRSLFARDAMGAGSPADSVSERSTSAGYNLLDLNVHVNPTSDMEVMAQLRVRNELGGFFGTGTTVDVRQLTLRGTIDNKIRYQVGDMFLRQTRFTLFNSASDAEVLSTGFQPYRDVIDYENFMETTDGDCKDCKRIFLFSLLGLFERWQWMHSSHAQGGRC